MKFKCFSLFVLTIFLVGTFHSCENGPFKSGPKKIGIQPLGNVSDVEIDSVKNALERMFEFDVYVLERVPMPECAYTEIRYPRYRADTLVEWLGKNVPDSLDKIIGLTNQDISITKYKEGSKKGEIKEPEWMYKDFGIFGLGRREGKPCVVSSNRLHKDVSDEVFYIRLTRIACHEIGHTLGLPHCPNNHCLMNDANESIKTIDKSTGVLCDDCKKDI